MKKTDGSDKQLIENNANKVDDPSKSAAKSNQNLENPSNSSLLPTPVISSQLDELVITNPTYVPIIYHEEKQQILTILLTQEKTLRELSDLLHVNPGTIKRHIDDLKNANLIFQSKEEKNEYGINQKFYKSTAKKFRIRLEFPAEEKI